MNRKSYQFPVYLSDQRSNRWRHKYIIYKLLKFKIVIKIKLKLCIYYLKIKILFENQKISFKLEI